MPTQPGTASLAEARVWLTRIHNAAISANYQGTMVFSSAGGVLSSSRVWHYCVGDQTYERLEALDGRQQHIVRHNDAVHTLWPQSRLAVVEKRETLAAWSTTPQSVDPQALEQYELRREGMTRVAGREAVVLAAASRATPALRPAPVGRCGQWADAAGRRPRPVTGQRAGVLESTAFSEVEIGVRPQPDLVLQAMRRSKATGCCGRSSSAPRWKPKAGCWPGRWPGFRHAGLHASSRWRPPAGEVPGAAKRVFRWPDPCVAVRRALQARVSPQRDAGPARCHRHADATPGRITGSPWWATCRPRRSSSLPMRWSAAADPVELSADPDLSRGPPHPGVPRLPITHSHNA
jgi:hypothetical protein